MKNLLSLVAVVAVLSLGAILHSNYVVERVGVPRAPLPTRHPAPVTGAHEQQQGDRSINEATARSAMSGEPVSDLQWKPAVCLPGTILSHAKLRQKCREQQAKPRAPHGVVSDVAPVYCDSIIASEGGGEAPCGQWAEGRFAQLSTAALDGAVRHFRELEGRCTREQLRAATLSFSGDAGSETLQADGCKLGEASAAVTLGVLLQASRGTGILWSGDSMMRQLFLRTIAAVRGQDTLLADHYFHFDAVYVVLADGNDALIPLKGNVVTPALARLALGRTTFGAVMATFFKGYSGLKSVDASGSASSAVLLAMMFNWETKPSVHRKEFAAMAPRLHIAAFMYWWQNKDPLTDFDGYATAVEQHFKRVAADSSSFQYVWVTTPWTAPKLFGGVEPPIRTARNQRATKWVHSLSSASPGLRTSVLDFAAVADAKRMPKTRDGIHYMCIWTPKLPDVVSGMKDNAQGCRDPMNRAVVTLLLHYIL